MLIKITDIFKVFLWLFQVNAEKLFSAGHKLRESRIINREIRTPGFFHGDINGGKETSGSAAGNVT
jgi:hypothetical protein